MSAETERIVERMRSDLFYVGVYRDRARALDSLGSLLRCETPGTVSEVVVKDSRWWRRSDSPRPGDRPKEIVLSDDERREFRDWCEERAAKLRKQADHIELSVAKGETDER